MRPSTVYIHFDEAGHIAHAMHSAPKPEKFDEYRLVEPGVKAAIFRFLVDFWRSMTTL